MLPIKMYAVDVQVSSCSCIFETSVLCLVLTNSLPHPKGSQNKPTPHTNLAWFVIKPLKLNLLHCSSSSHSFFSYFPLLSLSFSDSLNLHQVPWQTELNSAQWSIHWLHRQREHLGSGVIHRWSREWTASVDLSRPSLLTVFDAVGPLRED